jgi:tetratricopeptide (TPR) repeat protein
MNHSRQGNPIRSGSILFSLSLLLLGIAIVLLGFVLRITLQVRTQAKALDTVNALLVLQNEAETGADGEVVASVTIDDFFEIAAQVQAAESRAVNYLSVFEAIAFVTSVLGLLVVGVGILAAVIGVSNYASLLSQLDETHKRLQASQDALDDLRTGSDNIKQDISTTIESEWQKAHLALSLLPLADRQYRSGNVFGALETYERATALDPRNPVSFYYVGYIRIQRNDVEQAEKALMTALELDPNFYHAMAALGYTYRRIGERREDATERMQYFRKAETYLKQALAADERLVDADGEAWYGSLAGLYRRMKRIDDAFYYYEQAARVTPQSSYPAVNLALLALREGRSDINTRFARVQELAVRKIHAELEAYWGYADLLVAELVLGKESALSTVNIFLEILPPSVQDVLPRVMDAIDTIRTVPPYAGDTRNPAHLQAVMEILQAHHETQVSAN